MRILTCWLTLLALATPVLADSEHDRIVRLLVELDRANLLWEQAEVQRIVETLVRSPHLVARFLDQVEEKLHKTDELEEVHQIQELAITAFGHLAKPLPRVAERLDQWLSSADEKLIIAALVAIRAYGGIPCAAEVLAKLTRDVRPEVRRRAREAYKVNLENGQRLPYGFLLRSKDPDEIALGCLAASVSAKKAPQELVDALEHKDRKVYEAAYQAIVEIGDASPAATGLMVKHLNHEDSFRRSSARIALLTLRTSLEDLRQYYEAELRTGEGRRRARALNGLAWIGPPARDSLPTLRAIMKDKEQWGFWSRAAWALWCIAGDSQDVLAPLAAALDPLDSAALVTITRLGEEARPLSPSLRRVIEGSDRATARMAMIAVGAIGHADAKTIAALTKVMREHPSNGLRVVAGVVLAKLGHVTANSKECVLRRTESSVGTLDCVWAVTLAHSFGAIDREDAQKRFILMRGDNEAAAAAVLKALGQLGGARAREAIESVFRESYTYSYWFRRTAEESLHGQK